MPIFSPAKFIIDAGFFHNNAVHVALAVGGSAAVVSAIVGVFTVLRAQSFAGHALADISSAGGSAALLFGLPPLVGFLAMAMLAASGMEVIGVRQIRERDLVSGVVLGAGLGLTALFLYLDVSMTAASNATDMVMFGSMFTIAPETMIPALWVAVLALVMCVLLYRPLLLIAIDPDLATIRGINVRLIGLLYLLTLSIAVALSAMTIGAILSTALLIGPAAAAIRWSRRPASAIIIASVIAIGATWGGILLAYDSFYWAPNRGWPVSFFVVAMIFLAYLASGRTTTLARLRRALAG